MAGRYAECACKISYGAVECTEFLGVTSDSRLKGWST
jgi:hypothetical protein